MKTGKQKVTRKRPANLALNEDLVTQARSLTNNLSGVVEALLVDFIDANQQALLAEKKALAVNIATWNKFGDKLGAFADEYSSL